MRSHLPEQFKQEYARFGKEREKAGRLLRQLESF